MFGADLELRHMLISGLIPCLGERNPSEANSASVLFETLNSLRCDRF
jgi:hypothetical protein